MRWRGQRRGYGIAGSHQESIKPSKLHLRSIQPYLMAAFNHLRKHFKDASAWFLLAEQGKLCISLFDRGEWQVYAP